MKRRNLVALPFAAAMAQAKRPNILVILADDLGTSDMRHRGAEIETPNLDRLAREGTRFEQFYVYPVCSPTRSGLMTGRSPMRFGMIYHVIRPWLEYGVPLTEHFLPQTFQAAGYQTAISGKWHLGHSHKHFLPNARGFGHAYGHVNGAIDYFTHERDGGLDWHRNGKSVREEGYSTGLLAAEAVRWLRARDRSRPFFLYVPFNSPHSPLQAPQETLAKYAHIADPKRRAYAAMVDRLDAGVGEILRAIEGVAGETIVLFSSDNGGPLGLGATNRGLRDGKGSVYEGGIRSSAILRYPGKIAANAVTRQVMTILDVFPTFAAAAGLKPGNQLPFDGRNLWNALITGQVTPREDLFFAVEGPKAQHHAVIHGKWKLVRDVMPGGRTVDALFDLEQDPREQTDVSSAHARLTAGLAAKIDAWRALYPAGGVRLSNNGGARFKAPPQWVEAAR
jgi:arylsulfatase A-like enzyme